MARIIFLQRLWYEYGGPEIISAVLKQHSHETDLLIGRKTDTFLKHIRDNDIVAFSTMSGEHHWACNIALELKNKKNILTVFGGPHPTYFPEMIEHSGVDVICRGEGEFAFRDLADAIDKSSDYSNIPNLWVKHEGIIKKNEVRELVADLDALPYSDREIYYRRHRSLRRSFLKPFMASRGCPFFCSFCFNEKLRTIYEGKGRHIRFRSPENLIDEIKDVEGRYGLKNVYFADDLFVLDPGWLKRFTDLYEKEVKKPFVCSSNVNTLNEEVILMLKSAGCYSVSFGIETGDEKKRRELLNKNITNDQIEKVACLLKKHRLKFMTFNMLGLPDETITDAFKTVELNIRIGTDYPRCSILTPYPGTKIAERMKKKITIDDVHSADQQGEISFEVAEPRQLYNLHCFFQTAVIFPFLLGTIKRLVKFPPNILFKMWWALIYFFIFMRAEARDPVRTFIFAFKSAGLVFKKDA
ncbi:MAG: radical SAM protein [Candidatus Omnitrophota bacterium]